MRPEDTNPADPLPAIMMTSSILFTALPSAYKWPVKITQRAFIKEEIITIIKSNLHLAIIDITTGALIKLIGSIKQALHRE